MGLLDHYTVALFCFLRNSLRSSVVAVVNFPSHQQYRRASLFYTGSAFLICRFYDDGHAVWSGEPHYGQVGLQAYRPPGRQESDKPAEAEQAHTRPRFTGTDEPSLAGKEMQMWRTDRVEMGGWTWGMN